MGKDAKQKEPSGAKGKGKQSASGGGDDGASKGKGKGGKSADGLGTCTYVKEFPWLITASAVGGAQTRALPLC
ncbi:hypothetical protein Taro_037387 [Colocasia esculenta]|uniref:Uncharacterized protein n=1 Tax=Colocasia esculenta TaxID=4460 RepID=A0A843WKN5_COLES|nr:hypothetical protein [Colocasia esculenta]